MFLTSYIFLIEDEDVK